MRQLENRVFEGAVLYYYSDQVHNFHSFAIVFQNFNNELNKYEHINRFYHEISAKKMVVADPLRRRVRVRVV